MGVVSKIVVVCSDAYRSSISKCLDTLPDLNFMYIDVEEHVDIPEDALAVVISSLNYEENISFYKKLVIYQFSLKLKTIIRIRSFFIYRVGPI